MLKKCSSLLLALALITVLFTGCRGNAKNENQTGDPGTSTTSATTATKTADTTVRPTNVGSRSYSKEKVVWGPGNIADQTAGAGTAAKTVWRAGRSLLTGQ